MSDPRGKTLWEMFRDWVSKPGAPDAQDAAESVERSPAAESIAAMREEPAFFNPLGIEPGGTVESDGSQWTVTAIRDVTRRIAGGDFSFADYELEADEPTRLRVFPGDDGGYVKILLHLYEEFPVEQGFLDVVNDTTGVFDITDDNTGEITRYDRLHGVQGPYSASVRISSGAGAPRREGLQYWDWWRQIEPAPEFVFVEVVRRTVQIWRGSPA